MSPRTKLAVLAVPAVLLLAACSTSLKINPTVAKPPAVTHVNSSAPATSAAPAASTAPSTSAAASAGLSGTWSGHYSGGYQGTFTLNWTQTGSKLTGTIKISTPPATMSINGRVQGGSISFGTVGSYGITYSGTVSGNSMSGNYQVSDGQGSTGPWSAAKTGSVPATAAAAAGTRPSSPALAGGKATSSCDVISQAQASSALGQTVQPPVKGHAYVEGGVACVFDGPSAIGDDPDIPYADTVRVVLVTGPKAKVYFDDYRNKVSAQPLTGLGTAAFYDGFASISVLKGDAYVRIAVGIVDNLGAEKALAADALTRM